MSEKTGDTVIPGKSGSHAENSHAAYQGRDVPEVGVAVPTTVAQQTLLTIHDVSIITALAYTAILQKHRLHLTGCSFSTLMRPTHRLIVAKFKACCILYTYGWSGLGFFSEWCIPYARIH